MAGGCAICADTGDDRANRYDVVNLEQDLLECSGGGRRDFGIDLVGGDLENAFILPDGIAGLLQPLEDGGFHDTFTHFWHNQVDERHNELLELNAKVIIFNGLLNRKDYADRINFLN